MGISYYHIGPVWNWCISTYIFAWVAFEWSEGIQAPNSILAHCTNHGKNLDPRPSFRMCHSVVKKAIQVWKLVSSSKLLSGIVQICDVWPFLLSSDGFPNSKQLVSLKISLD